MTGSMCSRTLGKMNSWLQTACQPYSFWYGMTRSSMKCLPRSVDLRAAMISPAVSCLNAAARSASTLASSFIFQRASIESQLRSLAEFWRRPRSCSLILPWVFSMTARRLRVADSWAKLSIQWIFQWRSWMSIASSSSTARLHEVPVLGLDLLVLAFEIGEVLLHLGAEPLAPPGRELVAVGRQDGAEVGADLRSVVGIDRARPAGSCSRTPTLRPRRPASAGMAAVYR